MAARRTTDSEMKNPVMSCPSCVGALAHAAHFLCGSLGGWYVRAFSHHGAVSLHQAPMGLPLHERPLTQRTTLPSPGRPEVWHSRARPQGPRGEAFPGPRLAHLTSDPAVDWTESPAAASMARAPSSAVILLRMSAFLLGVSPPVSSGQELRSQCGPWRVKGVG